MAETETTPTPWTVAFREGMWEVTCSDGSLGGRFPREGDARTFAEVAGPGPMTIVSRERLEQVEAGREARADVQTLAAENGSLRDEVEQLRAQRNAGDITAPTVRYRFVQEERSGRLTKRYRLQLTVDDDTFLSAEVVDTEAEAVAFAGRVMEGLVRLALAARTGDPQVTGPAATARVSPDGPQPASDLQAAADLAATAAPAAARVSPAGEHPAPSEQASGAEPVSGCVLCKRGEHVCPGCGEATPHLRDDVAAACIRCAVEHDVVDRRVASDLPDTAEADRGA